jgi:hypothetical protein
MPTPLQFQYIRAIPWFLEHWNRSRYVVLDDGALRRTRRSDMAFVFGSGSSLNEITPAGWSHIAEHDTIGFNYFSRQRWVRTDYHLVGEVASSDDTDRSSWRPAIEEYARLIAENPFYARTIIGLQAGWFAYQSNRLASLGGLKAGTQVFRYKRIARGVFRPPSRALSEGLVHGAGSLIGCVNFAYVMGWRRIVIAGVDLYDSRYFWLPPGWDRPDMVEVHGIPSTGPHPTADTVIPYLARWQALMAQEGVSLMVYNPKSLLAKVLPVYRSDAV